MSRTRLYELRTAFLCDKTGYSPEPSGGDRRSPWPAHVDSFLEVFLPLQDPPNYQLVADEMERLCGFKRARSNVEAYVKSHFAHLVPAPQRKPRTCRRCRRAHIGELWQHDSSIHQWWWASSTTTPIRSPSLRSFKIIESMESFCSLSRRTLRLSATPVSQGGRGVEKPREDDRDDL